MDAGTRSSRRSAWPAALLLLASMVGAACGARVTDNQVASIGQGGGPRGTVAPAAGAEAEVPVAEETGAAATAEAAPTTEGEQDAAAPAPEAGEPGAAPAGQEPGAQEQRTASDVGVTPSSISLGHVTQLSGPVPGLFAGSAVGMNAYAAYANSRGGLAGRKVVVEVRDDQFDAAQNRAVTADLLTKTFALVGGVSLYDDASAADVGKSGAPDIPGLTLNKTRGDLPNNFAPAPNVDGAPTGQFLWFQRKFPDAVKAVGSIYGDVPSAKRSHENFRKAAESVGYQWKYDRGYQPTETDFTADVIRMRQSGVRAVFLIALDAKNVARVLKAAQQQNWKPDVWILGSSAYDRALGVLAGSAAEGVHVFTTYALYAGEDSAAIPEVKLFNDWYQKAKPGGSPDLYAAAAWISGRLLEQAMAKTGPNPTRQSVNAALREVTSYTGHGMQAEANPAGKVPSTCYLIARVEGGKYKRVEPADKGFLCEGTVLRR